MRELALTLNKLPPSNDPKLALNGEVKIKGMVIIDQTVRSTLLDTVPPFLLDVNRPLLTLDTHRTSSYSILKVALQILKVRMRTTAANNYRYCYKNIRCHYINVRPRCSSELFFSRSLFRLAASFITKPSGF